MNKPNSEYQLFKSLCHSGEVPRTTDNKSLINKLIEKGLNVKQTDNSYYLTQPVIELSKARIYKALNEQTKDLIDDFEICYQTESTNKLISLKPPGKNFTILLTEYQANGRGRRAKRWVSPIADNIYLSIQFQLTDTQNSHFLPLVTALCICRALNNIGISGCQIKWPNDIYLEGKKLGGVLAESRYNSSNGFIFTVGIGLNVNMQVNNKIDQSWISLSNHQKRAFDRNTILSGLLSELLSTYNTLPQLDREQFIQNWQALDYLCEREIAVTDEHKSYTAIAQGIAEDGALLIRHKGSNHRQKIYSADVSIKASDRKLMKSTKN